MVPGQLPEGTLLNERYRIRRALGHGGMGTVYLAQHERLDTVVAVKEVRGQFSKEEEFRTALQQCEREARFLVRLNHPNLPKVTDAFIENNRFYLVMEYIQGVTLEQRLRDEGDHPMEVELVMEWGLQIADVLGYLHAQEPPIVFRDLKPANIMIQPDGSVRLIDFGIARRFQPGANKDTALLGSVGYSPPEQFGKHQTDSRSDIYAFGVTLHQLVTGRDPAEQPFKFPAAHTLNRAVPAALSRLIEHCVALDPAARPPTIEEVANSLIRIRDEMRASPLSLPVAATGTETKPATSSPSANASGEGSGQKRPVAPSPPSRPMPQRAPSYSVMFTPERGATARAIAVAVALLLILLAVPAAFYLAKPHSSPRLKNKPMPPDETTQVTPPPTTTSSVTARIEGTTFTPHPQTGTTLSLTIAGNAQGKAGAEGYVIVYFSGPDGTPLTARDPNASYAAQDGSLIVWKSLTISADPFAFAVPLEIPLSAFATQPSSIKMQGAVFIGTQQVAVTETIPLAIPAEYYPSLETNTPHDTTPKEGGSGTDTGGGENNPSDTGTGIKTGQSPGNRQGVGIGLGH